MKEKTLLKIALTCSLIGLIFLYLISDNIELKEKNIEKITFSNKDEMVKIKGTVSKVIDLEKVTILKIMQPQEITVVMFKNQNKTMPFKEGNEIEVIGKVDEYEGNLEIIANKARVLR